MTNLSVGIIMDGNRRWAKAKGKEAKEGHEAGFQALLDLLRAYDDIRDQYGVDEYIFYGFSTENWNRSEEEVGELMTLLRKALVVVEDELRKLAHTPQIRFIGNIEDFDNDLVEEMRAIEARTKDGDGVVAIALSYGGRDEIVRAIQKGKIGSEEDLTSNLDTRGMKDPDIIIRTGGEKRLSNFLLWQAAYSELFFIDTLWPDFTKETLISCVTEYNTRERRHGV